MTRQTRAYQRTCRCGNAFETDRADRTLCFTCSPARIKPKGTVTRLPGTKPVAEAPTPVSAAPEAIPTEPGPTEAAIRNALEQMGLTDSWRAQIAIGLAQDLDRPGVTGAPRTSMSKQLSALMTEFEGMQPPVPDEIDHFQDAARKLQGL